MNLKLGLLAFAVLTHLACDRDGTGPDASVTERCCVRGTTKTLRLECEPGETSFVASACAVRPDAGVGEVSVMTCGDGKVDSTDECEGSGGCGSGSCINCTCQAACAVPPNPNPELLCSTNADCGEGNGECFGCKCNSVPFVLLQDAEGDASVGFDLARVNVRVQPESISFLVFPYRGARICVVEFNGSALVAQVCYFTQETVMAEFIGPTGSRLLIPNEEYGADGTGLLNVKRPIMPLAAGNSIFIYNASSEAPRQVVDRVPDKGGISVDRLLGTR